MKKVIVSILLLLTMTIATFGRENEIRYPVQLSGASKLINAEETENVYSGAKMYKIKAPGSISIDVPATSRLVVYVDNILPTTKLDFKIFADEKQYKYNYTGYPNKKTYEIKYKSYRARPVTFQLTGEGELQVALLYCRYGIN